MKIHSVIAGLLISGVNHTHAHTYTHAHTHISEINIYTTEGEKITKNTF